MTPEPRPFALAAGLVVRRGARCCARRCSKAPRQPRRPRRRPRPRRPTAAPPTPPRRPAPTHAEPASPGARQPATPRSTPRSRCARAETKPVFVYWGAKWCPPCNQVKATLFNRQDFIERSRAFVPVYVDGDSPGAQKIGARFRGQRLSDDGAVQRRSGTGGDAPARRGRAGPLHRGAHARHERGAAGQGGARRRARRRRATLDAERLAPARLLFVGDRPAAGGRPRTSVPATLLAARRRLPGRPSPTRRCGCA